MPNKQNIKKWIDALRSGRYSQAKGYLENNGSYCCLGVACNVAIDNGVEIRVGTENVNGANHLAYDGNTLDLPLNVMSWLGLDKHDPVIVDVDELDDATIKPFGKSHAIASWVNDTLGWSFEQIADALEKKYLKEEE